MGSLACRTSGAPFVTSLRNALPCSGRAEAPEGRTASLVRHRSEDEGEPIAFFHIHCPPPGIMLRMTLPGSGTGDCEAIRREGASRRCRPPRASSISSRASTGPASSPGPSSSRRQTARRRGSSCSTCPKRCLARSTPSSLPLGTFRADIPCRARDEGIQFAERPRNRTTVYSRPMRFDTIRDGETTSGRQRMRHRSGHRRRRSEDDGRAGSSPARPSRTTPGPTAGSSGRGARSGRVRPGADPGDRQRLDVERYHPAATTRCAPTSPTSADAYDFARRPQTLVGLTPCEYVCRDLDIRAGSIHPRSDPPDAGAEYLHINQRNRRPVARQNRMSLLFVRADVSAPSAVLAVAALKPLE